MAAFAAIAVYSIEATPLPSPLYIPAPPSPIAAHFIDPDTDAVLARKMRHADEVINIKI